MATIPNKNRTVKGKPIPEHLAHAIPSALTDQAIEERNTGANRVQGVGRVVRDASFERKLERMEREVEMGADPFKETIDDAREREPDSKFRFLSDSVVKKRGLRGWEHVYDEQGQIVKVAGMTLAAMPREIADLRDEKYRRMGTEQLAEAQDNLAESQERLIAASRAVGLSPLTTRDSLVDSTEPGRATTVGITSQRG